MEQRPARRGKRVETPNNNNNKPATVLLENGLQSSKLDRKWWNLNSGYFSELGNFLSNEPCVEKFDHANDFPSKMVENGQNWTKNGQNLTWVIFPNWDISDRMSHVLKNLILQMISLWKWSKMVRIGPKMTKFYLGLLFRIEKFPFEWAMCLKNYNFHVISSGNWPKWSKSDQKWWKFQHKLLFRIERFPIEWAKCWKNPFCKWFQRNFQFNWWKLNDKEQRVLFSFCCLHRPLRGNGQLTRQLGAVEEFGDCYTALSWQRQCLSSSHRHTSRIQFRRGRWGGRSERCYGNTRGKLNRLNGPVFNVWVGTAGLQHQQQHQQQQQQQLAFSSVLICCCCNSPI